jgi:uncharacterized protein YprB with RNaseH-like and TPR domain
MAKVNIARLKKDEIVHLYNHRCKKHGHRFLEHYGCYLEEEPEQIRIGFFDLETSNLKADFGIILSYSILDDKTDELYGEVITAKDLKTHLDRRVVSMMIADIQRFDLIVGYYSTKFDVPFARTRAQVLHLPFPGFGTIQHKDVYYIVRNKFALSRNRQEIAARMLVGKTEKTHILPDYWLRALSGDKKSLEYIFEHNKRDVRDLKRLYHAVMPFTKNTTASI